MANLTRSQALTIGDLFGLNRIIELNSVERISISRTVGEGHALYLFKCDGLLAEGQKLAIDDCRGIVGVYQDDTLFKEAQCSEVEIYILTALVLSFPHTVGQSQIEALCKLHRMNEDPGTTKAPDDESVMKSEQRLIAACDERLRPLGIAITRNDTEYQLVAIGK